MQTVTYKRLADRVNPRLHSQATLYGSHARKDYTRVLDTSGETQKRLAFCCAHKGFEMCIEARTGCPRSN